MKKTLEFEGYYKGDSPLDDYKFAPFLGLTIDADADTLEAAYDEQKDVINVGNRLDNLFEEILNEMPFDYRNGNKPIKITITIKVEET